MFQNITQIVKKKKVILLLIPNGKRWHYLVVKRLSALLRGITSKNHGDFYCLSCFDSFATESKSESHKKACENKDIHNVRSIQIGDIETFFPLDKIFCDLGHILVAGY